MHMRCASRIGHRLNGEETVATVGISRGAAIAAKLRIERLRAVVVRMVVAAMGVGLPDFEQHACLRAAGAIEHAADDGQRRTARPALAVDSRQVVASALVRLQRVEGAEHLFRRCSQRRRGTDQERLPGDQQQRLKKPAAAGPGKP